MSLKISGQQVGLLQWKTERVAVDARHPLEQIAELAGTVVFRGYSTLPEPDTADKNEKRRTAPDPTEALKTGLERMCRYIDGGPNFLARAAEHEARTIREFRRRVHHYLPGVSLEPNSLELLALMQHHGAPTRLLDWTYSPYVAAYFALKYASERADADMVIWTVRDDWCRDTSTTACAKLDPKPAALWESIETPADDQRAGRFLLSAKLPPSVWPLNPFRLNERLTIQQGLFLAPGHVNSTFLQNVGQLPSSAEAGLTRHIIPRAHSHRVAETLYRMNVTEATLFPGLDGFARSLRLLPERPRRGA